MRSRFANNLKNQLGQSVPEYVLVAAMAAAIFLLPFGGNPPLIVQFANAIGTGFGRFLGAMSLPL